MVWEIIKLQLTHYRDVCVERETKDTFRDKSFVVKDPNNCFLFSCSPTNWFAAATRSIESVLSLWTWSVMRWFSLASPVVARKYVLTRFKAENERSLAAFVAGITNSNFPSVQISERSNLWGSSIDWKNDIRSHCHNSGEAKNVTPLPYFCFKISKSWRYLFGGKGYSNSTAVLGKQTYKAN